MDNKTLEGLLATGRAEPYGDTGRYIAREAGTDKPIRQDGSLGGSFNPPLYNTEAEAMKAIQAREARNAAYAAGNTPEKQAEKKVAREKEIELARLEREQSIKAALAITPSVGYSITDVGNGVIKIAGKFDSELHSRLKRAGAGWDSYEKAWLMTHEKANCGLGKAFRNFEKAIEKADKMTKQKAIDYANAERQRNKEAADAERQKLADRENQPIIESGAYGYFYVSQGPQGYTVSFDYDAGRVLMIKALEHRRYEPATKNWWVDKLSATELKVILNKSVDEKLADNELKIKILEEQKGIHTRNNELYVSRMKAAGFTDDEIGGGFTGSNDYRLQSEADIDKWFAEISSDRMLRRALKKAADDKYAAGLRTINEFYSPCRPVPEVGDVITSRAGETIRVTTVVSRELSREEVDFQEEAGQPGLDYGTLSVTIEGNALTDDEAKAVRDRPYALKSAKKIEQFILTNGEFPKSDRPEGKIVLDTHNAYGSGDSFVIGEQYIWYVRGHGMDGDDWSQNNSGGDMVWRIPYSKEIADKLAEANGILDGLRQ